MLHAGLDLSRRRLDFHLLDESGETVELGAAPPDADGLRSLAERVGRHGQPLRAAIESMNGARFVHDQLELYGWEVEIADAQRVRGLAPLACKTDRIDARVLAELSRLELVPTIWLPTERVRAERERARFRPPSPPRSATSAALPRRRSWSATAASAHVSTSPASTTAAAGSPSTVPSTYAGPWSRRQPMPAGTRPTPSATSAPSAASANSAAPRSPRSTSPGGWQRRSGTCSPASNPSPRQAPQPPWLPDSPVGIAPPERTSHPPCPPQRRR